jgi:hypothetical protein
MAQSSVECLVGIIELQPQQMLENFGTGSALEKHEPCGSASAKNHQTTYPLNSLKYTIDCRATCVGLVG